MAKTASDQVADAFASIGIKSYPGSTPPIVHSQRQAAAPEYVDWRERGQVWSTPKGEIELYPVGCLRDATGMGYSTLRRWEADGILPLPLYHTPAPLVGKGTKGAMHTAQRRLYTASQIELVTRGIERFKITKRGHADWMGFTKYLLLGWAG